LQYRLENGPLIDSGDQSLHAGQMSELQGLWDAGDHDAFHDKLVELGLTVDRSEPEPDAPTP
jgi:hypothetical protein